MTLAKARIEYIVEANTDGWVYLSKLKIKNNIKILSEEKLFMHNNIGEDFEAFALPSQGTAAIMRENAERPNGAIVWSKGVKGGDWQIWLYIIK